MKYKNAKVISHPRAGSHYFAKLLNKNFFHRDNYLELYAGHSSAHKQHLNAPSTVVFYIYRNDEDTLKSMYKLRDRLGLKTRNFETFLTSRLKDMNDRSIKSEAIFNNGKTKKIITAVDSYMGQFSVTPPEYLDIHKAFWMEINRPNFLVVSYDSLINNFTEEMKLVAWFIESDKKEFKNIDQRIGWYDKRYEKKILS